MRGGGGGGGQDGRDQRRERLREVERGRERERERERESESIKHEKNRKRVAKTKKDMPSSINTHNARKQRNKEKRDIKEMDCFFFSCNKLAHNPTFQHIHLLLQVPFRSLELLNFIFGIG